MITIVTAFFDIGRADWSAYARSVDRYFKNFARLCLLENDVILFTESKHRARLAPLQSRKPNLTVYYDDDLFTRHEDLLAAISRVQQLPAYRQGLNDPTCPEYNSPKYVLVNYLKSQFCVEAIQRSRPASDTVAWIDFGYLRKNRFLPRSLRWDYDFGDKIRMFRLQPIDGEIDWVHAIKNNTVYIQGCHLVAPQAKWPLMARLMEESFQRLLAQDLMDDDQTLLLMSCLSAPEHFEVLPAELDARLSWFFIFRKFNRHEATLSLMQKLRFFLRTVAIAR